MKRNREDITGKTFNRLTAVKRLPNKGRKVFWLFSCSCGELKQIAKFHVTSGATKSCGCLQADFPNRKTHGMKHTSMYYRWTNMKTRCYNRKSRSFKNYGARGITMCEEWLNSFETFYRDMGEPPTKAHTIDRIDNDSGYSKHNCRWATSSENNLNKRSNTLLTLEGISKTLTEWAEISGTKRATISYRLRAGWSTEDAIFK